MFGSQEDKIECSEVLGDMTVPYSPQLALSVYLKSGDAHEKVIHCFMQTGGSCAYHCTVQIMERLLFFEAVLCIYRGNG